VHMTAPPAFPLPPVARVAAGLWLVLLWGVPGERWSFFLSLPHFVCTLVEGATTMLLALGLAFIPYIRNPAGRLLPPFILCAVLALDGYWIVARFGKAGVNSEVPVEQVLADVATTLNANLPKQVDSETRWDTVTSGPGKRMTAFYTLVNLSVADLNQAEFIEETRKQLVGDFRSNPYLARRMEVEWTYVFRDKRGETVATIIVSPRDL